MLRNFLCLNSSEKGNVNGEWIHFQNSSEKEMLTVNGYTCIFKGNNFVIFNFATFLYGVSFKRKEFSLLGRYKEKGFFNLESKEEVIEYIFHKNIGNT